MAGEDTEDWRGMNRTKKIRKSNNNLRAENDYVAINHDKSIDSLL